MFRTTTKGPKKFLGLSSSSQNLGAYHVAKFPAPPQVRDPSRHWGLGHPGGAWLPQACEAEALLGATRARSRNTAPRSFAQGGEDVGSPGSLHCYPYRVLSQNNCGDLGPCVPKQHPRDPPRPVVPAGKGGTTDSLLGALYSSVSNFVPGRAVTLLGLAKIEISSYNMEGSQDLA